MHFFRFSLEQLDFKGDSASVSETYAMSISVACVLEIARAVDILVHSAGNRRPGKSFIESCKDQTADSKDKTGIGSEAMKDRGDIPNQPCEGKFVLYLLMVPYEGDKSAYDIWNNGLVFGDVKFCMRYHPKHIIKPPYCTTTSVTHLVGFVSNVSFMSAMEPTYRL